MHADGASVHVSTSIKILQCSMETDLAGGSLHPFRIQEEHPELMLHSSHHRSFGSTRLVHLMSCTALYFCCQIVFRETLFSTKGCCFLTFQSLNTE